jgi:hypothetical protein
MADAYIIRLHKWLLASHIRGGAFVLAGAYVARQHKPFYIMAGHARNFSNS